MCSVVQIIVLIDRMISGYWIGEDIERNHHSPSCITNPGFVSSEWWYEGYQSVQLVKNLRLGLTDDMRDISQYSLSKIRGWDLLMIWGISVSTVSQKPEVGTYWWYEGYHSVQLVKNLRLGLIDDMRDIIQYSLSKTWGWDLLIWSWMLTLNCDIQWTTLCSEFNMLMWMDI